MEKKFEGGFASEKEVAQELGRASRLYTELKERALNKLRRCLSTENDFGRD